MNKKKRWMTLIVMVLTLTFMVFGSLVFAQEYPPQPPPLTLEVQPPAPPVPRVEVRTLPPAPDYLWTPGYWDWNGHNYVWMSGKWMQFPSPEATWVPAHWEQTANGWMWISGYWSH